MCGFAGFMGETTHPGGKERLLNGMAEAIAHRGPDGRGTFTADGVGLAHVRLSIVGLSDGRQPMSNSTGDIVITFNGEIFNYVELRDELVAKGHRFRTQTDTEVLLQLYESVGEQCLQHLNGDFAFAIWDGRRRRLLLARDRMGVRPLFYTRSGDTLYFASEIKASLPSWSSSGGSASLAIPHSSRRRSPNLPTAITSAPLSPCRWAWVSR